jgi:hypothetical protein
MGPGFIVFTWLDRRGLGGHFDSSVEGVVATDGQGVSLRVENPLVQRDQVVVAEQQVKILKQK